MDVENLDGESVWLHQAEALTGRMSRNVCEWSAKKELEMVVVGLDDSEVRREGASRRPLQNACLTCNCR